MMLQIIRAKIAPHLTLGEKIEKKAEEVEKQRREVWSQINLHNIAWGRVVGGIITIVVLLLLYLYWNPLVNFLATELKSGAGLIQSQSEAIVVANYLLVLLILATIGVEFISPLRDWLNRPKLSLHSFSYATNTIEVSNPIGMSRVKVCIAYLNLYNNGRGIAEEPIVQMGLSDFKIPKLIKVSMDMATFDKTAHLITASPYTQGYEEG